MQSDFIVGRCARAEAVFQRQQSPLMAFREWEGAKRWTVRQLAWASLWLACGFFGLTLIGAWR